MSNLIKKCIEKAGGIAKLAASLGIKHQSIYSWHRIPAEQVLGVERATGISRHELRPDIYPLPTDLPTENTHSGFASVGASE